MVGRVQPLGYGQAYLEPALPLVWSANQLWVTAAGGVTADRLAADAERVFGGEACAHRRVYVEHEPLWRVLADGFAALPGWRSERYVYMELRRPPDRVVDTRAVREVEHADVAPAEDAYLASEDFGRNGDTRRQLIEHKRRLGAATGERIYAATADSGAVAGWAKLRHGGGVAQVEDVAVLPEQRGRGLGRLVVWAAVEAALRISPAPHHVVIVADADDWPRQLYGRLGFTAVGCATIFHRAGP